MAMQMSTERQKLIEQVLEYWYTVDFLSQSGLKTEETRQDREMWSLAMNNPERFTVLYRHTDLREGEDVLSRITSVENLIREKRDILADVPASKLPCHGKITVYLGAIDQAYLSVAIANELKCDPPLNPSSSKLALAAIQLGDDGKYIKESLSLSPVVWSLGRIMKRQNGDSMYDTLDPNVYREAAAELEPEKDQKIVSYQDLSKFLKMIIEKTFSPLGLDPNEADLEETIHFSYMVYKDETERAKRETDDYFGLSMSFYADDLSKFRNAAAQGKWFSNKMWEALADYICAPYDMSNGVVRDHIDLGNDALKDPDKRVVARDHLKTILSVDCSPWGKWPSTQQPFFMQQVAINLAINTDAPIFAVNGPPGTGKTTLLREIVAEHVVQRALIMSEYEKPDSMFEYKSIHIGHAQKYLYQFRQDMKDIKRYGIIVASSNNNAVENITKQLPLEEGLQKGLAGASSPGLEEVREMFSLKNATREKAERLNYEKEGHPKEWMEFRDIYFSSYAEKMLREPCWGLLSAPLGKRSNVYSFYKNVLNQLYWDKYLQDKPGNRIDAYSKARKAFIVQYETVSAIRKSLKLMTDESYESGPEQYMDLGGSAERFSDSLLDDLASDRTDTRMRAQRACVNITKQYDIEREKLFGCALSLIKEFILSSAACKSNLELLSCAWGVETYNNPFEKLDPSERETKLRECMTPLIQTLQLMVPVISTTFASAGRFFKHVTKAEALGTVIVDEAGQATPQMALSLFSKASRAIVVGDPNQIDPVVTDELAFLESTLDDDIGEAYSDKTISVQKIADYLSAYGSEQSDVLGLFGKKWVGLPLYIHSRCIEPMFSISNRLSYGDTMLRITREPGEEKQFCYTTSQWINIAGEAESDKNHFVRVQGEKVLDLLDKAFSAVVASGNEEKMKTGPDIFVISPFHTVAEGIRQMLANTLTDANLIEKYPVFLQNRDMVEDWLTDDQKPHIGTVHTFQGREADEVILLLGCDVNSVKSANWVNRNIVNVAVSRAKYRLYAIGDVKAWRECKPIMEMKFDLDAYQLNRITEVAAVDTALTAEDEQLFSVPELPTSEMFDITDITEEDGEKELLVDTDSSISNIRAAIPGLASEFTEQQLSWFGLTSMDEFESSFDDKTKDHFRTGMWLYIMLRPYAEMLPEDYNVDFVGMCFCKAYEHYLKANYFTGLQKLFPDELVHGKHAGDIGDEPIVIGDITTFISNRMNELASVMNKAGYPGCDMDWWIQLSKRSRKCREYRNICAHTTEEIFHWNELQDLIDELLRGKDENGVNLPGLMMEHSFRDAMAGMFGKTEEQKLAEAAQAARDQQYLESAIRYCPVYCKMHVCPAEGNSLVQELVPVKNKDGKDKKLNMLHCRQCGRRFINVTTLPATIHLDDYYLEAVNSETWAYAT